MSLKTIISGLLGGRKVIATDQDPVASARADVAVLRRLAINIRSNAVLQSQVYEICDLLTFCLAEVERKPGHMVILGEYLTITKAMKCSLEEWTRAMLNGFRTEEEKVAKTKTESFFAELVPQYRTLKEKVVADNAKDLSASVNATRGFLSGQISQ